MHHFTRAEDFPLTLNTGAVSNIVFAPQNFSDCAQDGDFLNRSWATYNATTDEFAFDARGVALPDCAADVLAPTYSVWNYSHGYEKLQVSHA